MSDLTDLEICKRIAEIEGIEHSVNGEHIFYKVDGWPTGYNPLTDDGLCFGLMKKYKVTLCFKNQRWYIEDSSYRPDLTVHDSFKDESPNRAICLAIIEANKDK